MKLNIRWAGFILAAVLLAPDQPLAQTPPSYQGLWWNDPPASENGWGLNLTHQGNIVFGTWFTYDAQGRGTWYVIPQADYVDMGSDGGGYDGYGGYGNTNPGVYTYIGKIYRPEGAAYSSATFDSTQSKTTEVGNVTLTFSSANKGTFAYTIDGVGGSKNITRLVYGPMPTCDFAAAPAGAPLNFQDLWWSSPPGSESGWGVNLTHQGDVIFATWFTYDAQKRPMWFVMSNGNKTAPNTYTGELFTTTGPAYNAVWAGRSATLTSVGSATFTFGNANNGMMATVVNGLSQSKPITRLAFSSPSTVCH
jgi:hypothetical protein